MNSFYILKSISCTLLLLTFAVDIFSQNSDQKRAEYQLNTEIFEYKLKPENNSSGILYLKINTLDTFQINEIVQISNPSYSNIDNYFLGYLVNNSNKDTSILTQDGSLFIIMEAKNEDSQWKPIEYWVWSDCGNSYYKFNIDKKHSASFQVPILEGNFKTTLRLKLVIENEIFLYSNEFEGSINLTKFIEITKKQDSFISNQNKYLGTYKY